MVKTDLIPTSSVEIVEAPAAPVAPADPKAEQWSRARRFVEAATLFQRASLAAQVMAGMELVALHKAWNVKRGGDRRSKPHSASLIWEDAVKQELGISKDTATRWMEMAKAARPRLAKSDLQLGSILEKNPGSLTPAEQELLKRAVHKISDGQTQLEFLLECGVTRGLATRGGARTKAETLQELTEAQKRELWVKAARENALLAFDGIHGLGDRWKLLDDLQLTLALKEARALATEIDRWLKTEPTRRPLLDVEKVFTTATAAATALEPIAPTA